MEQFKKNYVQACDYLKRSTERPDVSKYSEKKQKRLNADHDLETILEANNMIANDGEPWEADLADTTQEKWYPGFSIDKEPDAPGGFRLSFYVCYYDGANALLGARHSCKTRSLAQFMGENCADIYHDTLS